MRVIILSFLVMCLFFHSQGEDKGYFSGNVMLNANFYQRDTLRGTEGPVYNSQLSGADLWLNVNYTRNDLKAGIRFDAYQNSILFNPTGSYSGQGIAMWYIEKQIDKLHITGGYFYDQFGSGITFRAYEGRGLGIDNAIMGVRLQYQINDNWSIKGFTGRQKNRFELYEPVIKGACIDGYMPITEDFSILPGASFVNRTLDNANMNTIVSEINSYPIENRFIPKYNTYTYSIYNTFLYKNFSLYAEYAIKTDDVMRGIDSTSRLINGQGSTFYTNMSYSKKGFGATLQFRTIDNYDFRTSPYQTILQGFMNYLPTFSRQNTYRLISRYNAIAQFFGEVAVQGDVIFTPKKGYTVNLSFSDIRDDAGEELYKELYGDIKIKPNRKFFTIIGAQYVKFNKFVYQGKGDIVEAVTPFVELGYKLTNKKSIRAELQYQFNDRYLSQDFGEWAYALLEFNIAPKYSFSVSDMYNIDPWRDDWASAWKGYTDQEKKDLKDTYRLHFPTVAASFTHRSTKFTLSYVKQVEGVVCTGGICRFQPAFSGVMASLLTSF